MSQYRIYLSVRRADTGKQMADITVMESVQADAKFAEACVERLSKEVNLKFLKPAMAVFWPNVPLLFVYMKEPIAAQDKIARSLEKACREVDLDIEKNGAVSAETVDLVRAALSLIDD